MKLSFAKYAGCGNDFVLIDDRPQRFPIENRKEIQRLCHRTCGIGADGLILLQNSDLADFKMRIFNADGSEAEMCGNGIRCLMKFIQTLGLSMPKCSIETKSGPLSLELIDHRVAVSMGAPKDISWHIPITIADKEYCVHSLNTGVPHVVFFTQDIESFDVERLGRKFRHHPHFAPQGTNFNVASLTKEGFIVNRTYERGVEAETLACGTGCVAAALAAQKVKGLKSPLVVKTRSLEEILVTPIGDIDALQNVVMVGPADKLFEGEIILQLN